MAEVSMALVNRAGPMTRLTNGSVFPVQATVEVDLGDKVLLLDLSVDNGQPVLDRMTVERSQVRDVGGVALGQSGGSLTPTSVRGVLSEKVLDRAIDLVARHAARWEGRDEDLAGGAALHARSRRSITDGLLREVAEVVSADPLGQPNRAVRRHFNYGSRQASRLIAAAKERGYLSDKEEDQ